MVARRSSHELQTYFETVILTAIRDLVHRYIGSLEGTLSFLELGGDSLTALHLSAACKRNGIILPAGVILQSKSIAELLCRAKLPAAPIFVRRIASSEPCINGGFGCQHDCSRSCSRYKRRRTSSYSERNSVATLETEKLTHDNVDEVAVTDMQLALIQGSAKEPGTNVIKFFQTYSTENIRAMKGAWKAAIESESIFRTTFNISSAGVTMKIGEMVPFQWEEICVDNEDDYEEELKDWPVSDSWIGNRFKVVSIDRGLHGGRISTIVWQVHHALIDGYSASLLYRKVQIALDGQIFKTNASFMATISEVHSYRALQTSSNRSFWKERAASILSAGKDIVLPITPQANSKRRIGHRTISSDVPITKIETFVHRTGVTVATTFFSAWALVLSQYCNTDSVVFGVVYSGRDLPIVDVEYAIGPLINTLPLCVDVQRSLTAETFVQNIFTEMTELGLRQSSVPSDGFARNFCSALAWDYAMDPDQRCRVKPIGKSQFEFASDIPLSISISGNGAFRITYNCSRYSESDMSLLADQYRNSILALLESGISVESCLARLMPLHCRETLLLAGNCHLTSTSPQWIRDDLVTLFDRTVDKFGQNTALEKNPQRLDYQALSLRIYRLAAHIHQVIQPGAVVCVLADRSLNWIIAIYAVLVAGGVYAPLDVRLPVYLRDMNCETAAADVFVAPYDYQKNLRPNFCKTWLSVEEILMDRGTESMLPPHVPRRLQATPEAPAYICFTSGSTGKPKAVLCSHSALVAFQSDPKVRLFSGSGMKIAQIMSPAFDGSIHEIFSTLSYGGTLVLPYDVDSLEHLMTVNSAILTPSVAKALDPSDYPRLQNVCLLACLRGV